MRIRLSNCEIIDPATDRRFWGYIEWEDGIIRDVGHAGPGLDEGPKTGDVRMLDGCGHLLAPSFVDLYADLCEPGFEYREDIASGSAAAASGGYTTVCASPNTHPVCDGSDTARFIISRSAEASMADVIPIGAITPGLDGESLSEMGELADAGVRTISAGDGWVRDTGLLRHAMEYAGNFNLTVLLTCEDPGLAYGPVHEGMLSTLTGLPATPSAAEEIAVSRHMALCALSCTPTHILKLSSAVGVRLVREARQRGLPLTASVTAHHLALTDDALESYDTCSKVLPPLRSEEDRRALTGAVKDGTIDVVVSDHAPRAIEDKAVEFDNAVPGASGIELTFALLNRLVLRGELPLSSALRALCVGPRSILGIDGGSIEQGQPADLVLLDKTVSWEATSDNLVSRGKNVIVGSDDSLVGRPVLTVRRGEIIFSRL